MPIISVFFGISIKMFFQDHLPPHFHAEYNDFEAIISINQISVINGKLPKRVLSLVFEWAAIHQAELISDWDLAYNREPLNKIGPLD